MKDLHTKGEKREKKNRKHMPMHGRTIGEMYRNAITKRASKKRKK